MFDFLFEGRLSLYLLLLLIAGILFFIWKQRPGRVLLRILIGVVLLIALLFLLDLIRETDREKALSTLDQVVERLNNGDVKGAFEFVADDFQAYNRGKEVAYQEAERVMRRREIRNIQLRSLEVLKEDREARIVTLRFNATSENNLSVNLSLPTEVDFKIDEEGRCRIISFRTYDPNPTRSDEEIDPFRW